MITAADHPDIYPVVGARDQLAAVVKPGVNPTPTPAIAVVFRKLLLLWLTLMVLAMLLMVGI
jgi:hypothetical protein